MAPKGGERSSEYPDDGKPRGPGSRGGGPAKRVRTEGGLIYSASDTEEVIPGDLLRLIQMGEIITATSDFTE